MKQHLPTLSAAHTAFLDRTFARNRELFGGWSMGPEDEGDDSGDGDDGEGDDSGDGDDGKGKQDDNGYPADTPVAQMTAEQQAAYWQHQSRKHEDRAKAYRTAAGGKTADELKGIVSEAEQARRNKLTVDDRALEDARNEGRTAVLSELGPKAVRSAFDLLLGDMPQKDKDEHLDVLDLSKFLTDDHQVDTDKVRAAVKRIQPDKGQQRQQREYGQGTRGGGAPAGSVAAVRAAREAARAEKTK